jgi:hypothetical protein
MADDEAELQGLGPFLNGADEEIDCLASKVDAM